MRIALVDPSLFTLPYDRALARGLQGAGAHVELLTRPLARDDDAPGDFRLWNGFYRLASRASGLGLPRRADYQVARLQDGWQEAGTHRATFDAAGLGSGVYYCRLQTESLNRVVKMLLMR